MAEVGDFEGFAAPGPYPTAESIPFWAAASEERLDIQQCAACCKSVFYPRAICPHCWSEQLGWKKASGRGKLLTWSVQHRPGHPAWAQVAPYCIGLVQLEEGPTMLSTILCAEEALRAGLDLQARFVRIGAHTLPMFEPAP